MEIVLLDDSSSAMERLQALEPYQPEHYQSLLEMAGTHPDLVLVDEHQSPEVVKELQSEWGLNTCVIAERVTLALRRRFPKLKDMIADAQLTDFLAEQFEKFEGVVEDDITSTHKTTDSDRTPRKDESVGERQDIALNQIVTGKRTLNSDSDPNRVEAKSRLSLSSKAESEHPIPAQPRVSKKPEANVSFMNEIAREREREQFGRKRASVFAVGPLRNTGGGAGKTAFVFNFASYVAKKGLSVLIVDLDPNGVLGTLVDAQGELNVTHWERLREQNPNARMTERAVRDSVENHPSGFSLITAASKASVIPTEVLNWIIDQTEPYFDLILVDTPAMWADPIVSLMKRADRLILIGLHDAAQYPHYKATLDLLTNPAMAISLRRDKIRVVVSRAYLGKNRDVELEEISRQLDVELSLIIPEDPRFYEYRENHRAIVLEKRNAEYSKVVIPWFETQLADLRQQNLPAIVGTGGTQKQGFFGRLFGGKKSVPARS